MDAPLLAFPENRASKTALIAKNPMLLSVIKGIS